jgi:DNA-binding NarL/FixJ family response regulator
LAAVDIMDIPLLASALKGAGEASLSIIAGLEVAELRKIGPGVLVADIDRLESDPLEMLRQLRFVLPDCVIVVYTANIKSSWGRACHLAGASCLLSKGSSKAGLVSGLQRAIRTGCFTDPHFAA